MHPRTWRYITSPSLPLVADHDATGWRVENLSRHSEETRRRQLSTLMIIPIQRSFGRLISRRFHNCQCCSPWQARNGYHKLRYEQYEELDHLLFYGLLAYFLELIISTIATIASRIPTKPVTSPTVRAALASSSASSISSWAFLISSCASLNVSRAN